ncbi:hypothetical protein CC85DRAFT_204672 [Cutaneotrichosporon oleaginosum]|uniref:Uncharacterized protein n=1 Tax=Cutaneotrichosporon oleaginosum TaxID=879819 RepID=A0A0J0XDT2_9TREE|nr:uncharacterized protein CC85DRAFT_204672 [Cutaneotrichosporon oleaginosum]KLT39232.1 hypothetical protein CC85DRAFT_204672 [Cutaneotrichosporon oleaginosum]TXT05725.1 hypothetical protein COLE_07045 [Cutaneotrichosporon oleaginosum]
MLCHARLTCRRRGVPVGLSTRVRAVFCAGSWAFVLADASRRLLGATAFGLTTPAYLDGHRWCQSSRPREVHEFLREHTQLLKEEVELFARSQRRGMSKVPHRSQSAWKTCGYLGRVRLVVFERANGSSDAKLAPSYTSPSRESLDGGGFERS